MAIGISLPMSCKKLYSLSITSYTLEHVPSSSQDMARKAGQASVSSFQASFSSRIRRSRGDSTLLLLLYTCTFLRLELLLL